MNNQVKSFLISIGIIISMLLFFSIVISTLYYFDIINNHLVKYFKIFLSITSFFIGGIYIGSKSVNKGYINGLKISAIIITIFIIFGLIFSNIALNRIIYYIIIALCITFGAMIGINKKGN